MNADNNSGMKCLEIQQGHVLMEFKDCRDDGSQEIILEKLSNGAYSQSKSEPVGSAVSCT